jgi:hypothetical protein
MHQQPSRHTSTRRISTERIQHKEHTTHIQKALFHGSLSGTLVLTSKITIMATLCLLCSVPHSYTSHPTRWLHGDSSMPSNGQNIERLSTVCLDCLISLTSREEMNEGQQHFSNSNNLYRMADAVAAMKVMNIQESTRYRSSHYLGQTTVSAEDRRALCKWGYEMVDACKLDRYINIIAMGYFDRFMSNRGLSVIEVCLESQREFQLAYVVSSTPKLSIS